MSRTIVTIAAILFGVETGYGQEASAGITGRITDATGGAIAGASITARDQQRGTSFPTRTNEDGIYVYPRLPVGTYDVRVESPGFKAFVANSLTLEINQRGARGSDVAPVAKRSGRA